MKASGAATLDVRSVEWLRDHGFNGLVDRAQSWWLWRNTPSTTARLTGAPHAPLSLATPVRVAPLTGDDGSTTEIAAVVIVPAPTIALVSQ